MQYLRIMLGVQERGMQDRELVVRRKKREAREVMDGSIHWGGAAWKKRP